MNVTACARNLRQHVVTLTETIGERSLARPDRLRQAQDYIQDRLQRMGLRVRLQPYRCGSQMVANIIADEPRQQPDTAVYLLGAHYDSLQGTVGADDNASAVAVMLEAAAALARWRTPSAAPLPVRYVAFALEEPPVYGTAYMGSRVYARQAARRKEALKGMLCLEMVGYTCGHDGCQDYPLPLFFRRFPTRGDYIAIVANSKSKNLAQKLGLAIQRFGRMPVERLNVPFGGYLLPTVRLSDHASFWDKGYRAVMITDTAFYRNPNYHTAADTAATLDYAFMARLVAGLTGFLENR
jgi:Zn-dependent M28 family amino/carboxypeptidase